MKIKILMLLMGITTLMLFPACSGKGTDNTSKHAIETGRAYTFPLSLQKAMASSEQRAYTWITGDQKPDGSWNFDPAITALVLYGLMENPGNVFDDKTAGGIRKGYAYLEKFFHDDGSIYNKEYSHYSTAVSVLALTAFENLYHEDKYVEAIKKAKDFLIVSQCDESENINKDNPYYGGIGYGGDARPDLSNTHLALDAIKAAEDFEKTYKKLLPVDEKTSKEEMEKKGLHWKKAMVFLARCQNLEEVNKMPYNSGNDGGFMYETGKYKEERSHSYGSMTYAGVKSMLYADVDKTDIRVVKALEWIKNNYTLEVNPGFGTDSLYYYYMTFGKCMNAIGGDFLTDAAGVKHHWREELVTKLLTLQKGDGFWINDSGRYWENMANLATAYSLIAMKYAMKGLSEKDIASL